MRRLSDGLYEFPSAIRYWRRRKERTVARLSALRSGTPLRELFPAQREWLDNEMARLSR